MTEPVREEVFDYDKAEPFRRKFKLRWLSNIMFYGASAMFGAIGGLMLFEDSGPKNGITNVEVVGCNLVDQHGPGEDANGEKVTMRTVRSNGLVRVTLWSYELPEDAIRDAGRVVDPAVAVNDLLIECESPLQGPDRRPGIQHISAQNTLAQLGG